MRKYSAKLLVNVVFAVLVSKSAYGQGRNGVGTPNAPTAPSFYPVPVQNYAVVDVSGTTATSGVTMVAMDDKNNVAFTYNTFSLQGTSIIVNTWQNGVVSPNPVQTIPTYQVQAVGPDGTPTDYKTLNFTPPNAFLRVTGDVLGDLGVTHLKPWYNDSGNLGGYVDNGSYNTGYLSSSGTLSEIGGVPVPPYETRPSNEPSYLGSTFLMTGASPTGFIAEVQGWNTAKANPYAPLSGGTLLTVNSATVSSTTLFDPYLITPSGTGSSNIKVVNQSVNMEGYVFSLNSSGWAIGYANGGWAVWNGASFLPIPGDPTSINESNDVLVNGNANPTTNLLEGAGLLDSGSNFIPFLTSGTTTGLIPQQYQKQIRNIYPFLMSNRFSSQGTQVYTVLHIIFVADTMRVSANGSWWQPSIIFELRKFSDGTTDLSEINIPFSDLRSVNYNGVVCGTGYMDGNGNSTSQSHALIALPINITVKRDADPKIIPNVLSVQGDVLDIALSPSWINRDTQLNNLITWQWRELYGDGTFTDWNAFNANETGTSFQDGVLSAAPGIYQIRANITTGNNIVQNYPFNRKQDDPYGKDSHGMYNPIYRQGQPDYVGVCSGAPQYAIVKTARQALGSTAWAETATITLSTGCVGKAGAPKCNFFDYQMVTASGSTMPVDSGGAPPRAYDMWNSSFSMAGWAFHDGTWYPTPGSLATRYLGVFFGITVHLGNSWHAHTGILDYDGAWINAGPVNVNRYPHPTVPEYGDTGHYRSN